MKVSAARIEANRRNASKSTGPRSAEGKLASRENALKHGMTATVVMLGGDAAEVERRAEAMEAELRPDGEVAQVLVRRLALLSVRMERCATHEAAALADRVRSAPADFDDRRLAEVDALFASLASDPASGHRRLCRMPEGVDRLILAWQGLLAELKGPDRRSWDASRANGIDALLGRSPSDPTVSRPSALARSIGDSPGDRWRQDSAELIALIDAEIARLRAHRATLDLAAIEVERAAAPALALFDTSRDAILARQYEAAAERGFFRSLRELRMIEPEPEDADPTPRATPAPLASFPAEAGRISAPAAPPVLGPKPSPRPTNPTPVPASFVPFSIGKSTPGAG